MKAMLMQNCLRVLGGEGKKHTNKVYYGECGNGE